MAEGSEEKGAEMSSEIPSFSYPGGKAKLREWMVRRMPLSGRRYVEPFVGRGNVFWMAACVLGFEEWHLNDTWTCRWFEAIQKIDIDSIPDELTRVMAVMSSKRSVSHRMEDDLSVAMEPVTTFRGGALGGGGRGGICTGWRSARSLKGFKRRLLLARRILRSAQPRITALSWEDCELDLLSASDFVYLDPPYENTADGTFFHNTVIHADLLKYLTDAPHLWMLSGCESDLYRQHLGAPEASKIQRMTMEHSPQKGRSKMRTECIWTNYTIDSDGVAVRKPSRRRARIRKRRLRS